MKRSAVLLAAAVLLALPVQATPARPAITGVSHLAVYSADMAKSEVFYTKNLGAVKGDDPENPKGVRYYFNPRQFVEVLPLPQGYASVNRMDHAAFNTADAEGMRTYLATNHIKVPRHVTKGSDGSKWFEVNDPEGNRIEFVQLPDKLPDVPIDPLSGHLIHFGMIAHNEAVEDAFYRKILGFRPYWFGGPEGKPPAWISQQVPDGSDWMEYMMVSGPETKGIPADMTQSTAGVLNHFALGVANMEKTVTTLAGGERISEKSDGPKIGLDGKWQFNMYDPDGTRAEFMEYHAVIKPCCSPFTASDPNE
jgi:catechol 2,3-dioxygenase-like lactoylglutathione lyase family enzyme